MNSRMISISIPSMQKYDEQVVTSAKQVKTFITRAQNDVKQGSRPLIVYEITETGEVNITRL